MVEILGLRETNANLITGQEITWYEKKKNVEVEPPWYLH